ncbi:hypothetical protein ACFL0V_04100 [Nanoarchaeota archaeon]
MGDSDSSADEGLEAEFSTELVYSERFTGKKETKWKQNYWNVEHSSLQLKKLVMPLALAVLLGVGYYLMTSVENNRQRRRMAERDANYAVYEIYHRERDELEKRRHSLPQSTYIGARFSLTVMMDHAWNEVCRRDTKRKFIKELKKEGKPYQECK